MSIAPTGDEVEVVEVLRTFVNSEVEADKYEPMRAALHDSGKATQLFTADSVEAIEMVLNASYAQEELVAIVLKANKYSSPLELLTKVFDDPAELSDDEVRTAVCILGDNAARRIPLVPFTLGDRSHRISRWIRASVQANQCWIPCVNEKTNAVLVRHDLNLAAAAPELLDEDGWRTTDGGIDSLQPIICIGEEQTDGGGQYRLLDGCHRVVGVAKQNPQLELTALVGVTRAASEEAKGLQELLDEMRLYYEEVRDVNTRTLTIGKAFVVVALALSTYTLFGLHSVLSEDFWLSVEKHLGAVRAAAKVYAVSGLLFCLALSSFGCLCVRQLGHSRRHKLRYWRAVSLLRQKLHERLSLVSAENPRAVTIQTGLETERHTLFKQDVPRPFVKKEDFFLGYGLGFINLLIFILPTSIFFSIWEYANQGFGDKFGQALGAGFANASPIIAVFAIFNARAAVKYCRDLKIAQLITPEDIYPRLPDFPLSRTAQSFMQKMRVSLVVAGLVQVILAFSCATETWLWFRVLLAFALVAGALAERILSWKLSQRPLGANLYQATMFASRALGAKGQLERAERWLGWAFAVETVKRWGEEYEQRKALQVSESTAKGGQ